MSINGNADCINYMSYVNVNGHITHNVNVTVRHTVTVVDDDGARVACGVSVSLSVDCGRGSASLRSPTHALN